VRTPIWQIARGKWQTILPQLGIAKEFLVNRHGPCPMCEGKDRFRFDDKDGKGTWFCNQCGAGEGIELVKRACRMEFKEAAQAIERIAGTAPIHIRTGPDPAKIKESMNLIWKSAAPLSALPATVKWWHSRLGHIPETTELRAVQALSCPEQGLHPAMVAKITDVDGKPVNLHRTFLTSDGRKADFPEIRRVMPIQMPKGCAVRLAKPTDVLGIAEGIETAAAVTKMFGVPCWAAVNANNMEGWIPPADVRVIIYGDNDLSFTGQASAFALAKRLRREKREVSVSIPERAGWDWNDVLLNEGASLWDSTPPSIAAE